jgi:hypothetical protein
MPMIPHMRIIAGAVVLFAALSPAHAEAAQWWSPAEKDALCFPTEQTPGAVLSWAKANGGGGYISDDGVKVTLTLSGVGGILKEYFYRDEHTCSAEVLKPYQ